MKELNEVELEEVSGGDGGFSAIGHAIGSFAGNAAAWFDSNISSINDGYSRGERV